MTAQLAAVGAVICAASADLAPADRKLYALRDVTGTVESIPMIAASIMSKKIAEGTEALVLDVKVGTGAFMKRADHAAELARTMVELGAREGVRTTALLTDMSHPAGPWRSATPIEVAESVEVLAGGGPADVVELTLALAREMVALAGLDVDPAEVLASGRAMDSWRAMVAAQGGDPDARAADAAVPGDRGGRRQRASWSGWTRWRWASPPGGWARAGPAGARRAAGRRGALPGQAGRRRCAVGQPLFELHTDTPERFAARAGRPGRGAITIAPAARPVQRPALVLDVITAG